MNKLRRLVPFLGAVVLSIVLGLEVEQVEAASNKDTTIIPGISIATVDVSGMTKEEATQAVNDYIAKANETEFQLVSEVGSVKAKASDLGITAEPELAVEQAVAVGKSGSLIRRYKDTTDIAKEKLVIKLGLQAEKQTAAKYLYDKGSKINKKAVNVGLKREGGKFSVVPGEEGNEVDYVQSVYAINSFLENWDGESSEIKLVSNVVAPKGSAEQLADVKDVLGTFSTYFGTGTGGRFANVTNGCKQINGHTVYPGEEFSANAAMEPYTVENGYREGGAYENGRVVSSIGGGICQVSTTLYNAVIRAELEVTQRAPHSMVVGYVKPSEDAAIAGDYKDFRFKNNTNTPIYIEGYCSNGNVIFNIYGKETRAASHKVTFENEVLEEQHADPVIQVSAEQPAGYYNVDTTEHVGYVARLWKIVTENGAEASRKIFNRSTYKPAAMVVTVGTNGATPEQIAALNAAIATKDVAQVQAAAAAMATSAPADAAPTDLQAAPPVTPPAAQ